MGEWEGLRIPPRNTLPYQGVNACPVALPSHFKVCHDREHGAYDAAGKTLTPSCDKKATLNLLQLINPLPKAAAR